MKGKNKCKILKQIRQRIADENDIPYVTRECTYQGDCKGTCPKCEAELRYLEQELEKRRRLGQSVAIAAVAATLSLSLAGCVGRDGGKGSTSAGAAASQTQSAGTGKQETDPERTEPTQGSETVPQTESTRATESCESTELSGEIEMPLEGEPAVDETTTPADTSEEFAGVPEPDPNLPTGETEYLELEGELPPAPNSSEEETLELMGDVEVFTEPEQPETGETAVTEAAKHD